MLVKCSHSSIVFIKTQMQMFLLQLVREELCGREANDGEILQLKKTLIVARSLSWFGISSQKAEAL